MIFFMFEIVVCSQHFKQEIKKKKMEMFSLFKHFCTVLDFEKKNLRPPNSPIKGEKFFGGHSAYGEEYKVSKMHFKIAVAQKLRFLQHFLYLMSKM